MFAFCAKSLILEDVQSDRKAFVTTVQLQISLANAFLAVDGRFVDAKSCCNDGKLGTT